MTVRTPPRRRHAMPVLGAALLLAVATAHADEYAYMLGYLADTRIEADALAGASGAIAVNQAAGDLNQQANVRAIATGGHASALASARQQRSGDVHDTPIQAGASIAGNALAGASGLASINQASGSANAQFNAVALAQADTSKRSLPEAPTVAHGQAASAEQQSPAQAARAASRRVAVEATALRGFEGVLQLNQIAGSANDIGNQLSMSVSPRP